MIAWTYRGLLLLAGLLGLLLARRLPRYRPIPRVLLGLLVADLTRELAPRAATWSPRGALHLQQALALAFPVASSWLALRVLAGRGALVPVALGVAALLALVVAYPLDADSALLAFGLVHAGCAGTEIGAVVVAWTRSRTVYLPERAVIILVAGDAAGMLGPWLGHVAQYWDLGVLQGLASLIALCYFEARWALALRARGGAS